MKSHVGSASSLADRRRGLVAAAARAYIRRGPTQLGKRLVYRAVGRAAKGAGPVVARTGFGFRMFCDLEDLIQSYIYHFGVWEPDVSAFLARRLRPGDVFIDVGAHVGYHSLLSARIVGPSGKVVAVEASPRIFTRLKENLALNCADNVVALNVAASDSPGQVQVYAATRRNTGETTIMRERQTLFGERGFRPEGVVPAAPLDAMVQSSDLARAKIVKLDVEGAEGPVLHRVLDRLSDYGEAEFLVELSGEGQLWFEAFEREGYHAYRIENDYRFERYLHAQVEPPRRAREAPADQADIIFSRIDAETL